MVNRRSNEKIPIKAIDHNTFIPQVVAYVSQKQAPF